MLPDPINFSAGYDKHQLHGWCSHKPCCYTEDEGETERSCSVCFINRGAGTVYM